MWLRFGAHLRYGDSSVECRGRLGVEGVTGQRERLAEGLCGRLNAFLLSGFGGVSSFSSSGVCLGKLELVRELVAKAVKYYLARRRERARVKRALAFSRQECFAAPSSTFYALLVAMEGY
jgi:hypothetical protein